LWKALGKAAVLSEGCRDLALVLLTTDLPVPGSAGAVALEVVKGSGRPVFDVVALLDPAGQERLGHYARQGRPDR
jgi:hypothetical protein